MQLINDTNLLSNIGLHTSGQDITSFYFSKHIGPHASGQDVSPFLRSFKMLNIITDHKIVPPLSTLSIMELLPLSNQKSNYLISATTYGYHYSSSMNGSEHINPTFGYMVNRFPKVFITYSFSSE